MSDLNQGKSNFKTALIDLQKQMITKEEDAFEEYAEQLSEMIYQYIKSAKVKIPANIPVTTAGTAASQTGATTAVAIGTLE